MRNLPNLVKNTWHALSRLNSRGLDQSSIHPFTQIPKIVIPEAHLKEAATLKHVVDAVFFILGRFVTNGISLSFVVWGKGGESCIVR